MWPDAAIVITIALAWWLWLYGPVREIMPVGDDSYRDTAYVENILEGRVLEDPSMPGLSWWYAPGGPLFFAAISRVTGVAPIPLYSSSILWLNVWIPIGIFLVVRLYWDRAVGVAALLMVWLGSRWWQTHMAMPLPSVQGLVLVLLALAVWRAAIGRGYGWSIVLGFVLATCTWHHILSGAIVSAAIGLHALSWAISVPSAGRYGPFKRALVAGGVCGVLVSPLAWHLLTTPWRNSPHSYVAQELGCLDFAVHAATPMVIPLAVTGIVLIARRLAGAGSWVLSYLVVGLAGQGTVYLRRWLGIPLPILLPHEFQWHGQFAVGVLAGVGLVGVSRLVVRRLQTRTLRGVASTIVASLLVVAVIAPDGGRAWERIDDYWHSGRCSPDVQATMEWIRRNSEITDVFVCRYIPAYYEVAGRTGRKLILMPEGRANFAADVQQRRRDLYRLEMTQDPQEFVDIAVKRYGARFVYIVEEESRLLERWLQWECFELAYRSPEGKRTILRIIDPPGTGR